MTTYITKSGTTLMNGASQFNFSGCNVFWLGLKQDPAVGYPTHFEIDDALKTAKEMGATVIRSQTLGVSTGNSYSIWPTLNSTNTAAFEPIDYAIYRAGLLGIKLIIPLTDNYRYYHGGKYNFTTWRSVAEANFYTDSNVISDFEAYISVLLNRTNQYNSIAYKNDPTILAWQLGNELSNPYPGGTWTSTIATYINSIDSNHLVMDGSGTLFGYDAASLSVASIDIMDDHFYPPRTSLLATDITAFSGANKVYIVGEYDWTRLCSLSTLQSFLSAIESNSATIAGDCYWSLFPHNDTYGFITHADGYSLYYPGATSDQISKIQALRTHAYKQSGVTPAPAALTIATAPITSIVSVGATNKLAWQGIAGAATYIVQRAPSYDGPWVTASGAATDFLTPLPDTGNAPYDTWYKVCAVNYDGGAGPYSTPVNASGVVTGFSLFQV